jgi:hypothetical protein
MPRLPLKRRPPDLNAESNVLVAKASQIEIVGITHLSPNTKLGRLIPRFRLHIARGQRRPRFPQRVSNALVWRRRRHCPERQILGLQPSERCNSDTRMWVRDQSRRRGRSCRSRARRAPHVTPVGDACALILLLIEITREAV